MHTRVHFDADVTTQVAGPYSPSADLQVVHKAVASLSQ